MIRSLGPRGPGERMKPCDRNSQQQVMCQCSNSASVFCHSMASTLNAEEPRFTSVLPFSVWINRLDLLPNFLRFVALLLGLLDRPDTPPTYAQTSEKTYGKTCWSGRNPLARLSESKCHRHRSHGRSRIEVQLR
ncbi:hypothetical protein LIA77_11094 [Sarocladium implicatum]|nr:hypothetical protein LIA77_11094 [Sarocladium implicatum]